MLTPSPFCHDESFLRFCNLASFASKAVNGHHRIPVIQAPWLLTREIAVDTAWDALHRADLDLQ